MEKMAEKQEMMPTERVGIYKVDKGTLINRDNTALQAYKMQKKKMRELSDLKEEFFAIKEDIDEIKKLLRGLIK